MVEVESGSPADKAGLKGANRRTTIQGLPAGGDWIIAIDGYRLTDYNSLISNLVVHYNASDTITLTILRGGKEMQLSLTLGARPD